MKSDVNEKRLLSDLSPATRRAAIASAAALIGITWGLHAAAVTSSVTLADQPVVSTTTVPGNLAFTLSVEYPTAISVANLSDYVPSSTYLGYFDPAKCYTYVYNGSTSNGAITSSNDGYSYSVAENSYFKPTAFASATHGCSGTWSGNFMNWVAMQTIDPFRWVLTGGLRTADYDITVYPQTVLEKAWASTQGSASANYPYRGTDQPSNTTSTPGNYLNPSYVASVTPLTKWTHFNSAIWGNGNSMLISGVQPSTTSNPTNYGGFEVSAFNTQYNVYDLPGDVNSSAPTQGYTESGQSANTAVPNTSANLATYRVYIRVSVCDTSVLGVMGLESNCVGYGTPNPATGIYPMYKPQGLIQQYSNQIKYSVFSYLDTFNEAVQGGVLREPMEFVGPTYPTPLSTTVTTNPTAEWYPGTGIIKFNPDTSTANASGVSQSGVMNYINGFGEAGGVQYAKNWTSGSANNGNIYMQYDHVSELYYAAVRYFENLGNVSQWLPQSAYGATSVQLDGFPAVTTWTDPIAYRCQKNFILGIGDDHTWTDYDVGGSSQFSQNIGGHSPAPSAVTGDTFNQANTWLNELEVLEGLPQTPWWSSGESGATLYIAGLAYGAHVLDIRPDLTGTQTIATYWMDVAENQVLENENQYYLAAKYGGFNVPANYSITNTTPLPLSEYDTSGQNVQMRSQVLPLPNNYFNAGSAQQMVTSLTSAFANIALAATGSATAFSVANANSVTLNSYSFLSSYSSSGWTGTVTADSITSFSGSTPVFTQAWTTDTTLQTQLAAGGWQNNRNVVTWSNGSGCGSTFTGVPFEAASLCASTQLNALAPSYSTSTTGTQYLNYLRGDISNQVGTPGGTQSLRARALFLGDIVDAALTPVANPTMAYSESSNPGYTAFKTTYANRPTMVYAAANDGMVHGFLGSNGTEVFAYVPNALYQGPTGTPQVNGLAQLGNPNYTHHFYVDATPITADLDLANSGGSTGTPNWATALIGGLGKGGTSFYAIDVTDAQTLSTSTEAAIAKKVLWEYTDSTMGYSFGTPVVAKVAQYGWVVLLTSGYDNSDGYGYLYIVNPATGALLQKIRTPSASSGLTQASAFTENYTDYTAESVYVGDLNGQVWRFNLTTPAGHTGSYTYPAPTLIAQLTDPSGNPQPVTSAPDVEIHPVTLERYVLIGTGRLLNVNDVPSTQVQTFYAIIDGYADSFNPDATPATRTNMTAISNITAGATIPSTSRGWYYDLSAGYRVLSMPVTYNGVVAFSALLPTGTSSDPCDPVGSSEVFATNYSTGTSVLNSNTTGFISFAGPVTTLSYLNTGSSNAGSNGSNTSGVQLFAGGPGIPITAIPTTQTSLATRTINWREIPTPD